MKSDVMDFKAPLDVDVSAPQAQLDDGLLAAGKTGRKLALAYVGLWGYLYDFASDLYIDSRRLLGDAVRRGESMEVSLNKRVDSIGRRTAKQFNFLQDRFGENVEQVTRSVTDTGENFEGQLEKQVERVLVNLGIPTRDRLERLNQEIDRLSARLDEELVKQDTVHA